MCEDFPLYTFNNEIVSYMGITCTKTDLFKDLRLSKDIHDALKIIDKRYKFKINDNELVYNFICFDLETDLVSYKFSHNIKNIKDFIENFNILLISLDVYNKKYCKYENFIDKNGIIISTYMGIIYDTNTISFDIHQNIELLLYFLEQNFGNYKLERNALLFIYKGIAMVVNLDKIIVNKKEFYYTFEAIEYIKSLFPAHNNGLNQIQPTFLIYHQRNGIIFYGPS
jgi:hypothetical protein